MQIHKNQRAQHRFTAGLLCLSVFAILFLSGCSIFPHKNTTQAALDYLEQRYGQEFVYSGPWGASYANPSVKQILVRPVGEEADVLVCITSEGAGYSFQDNYLAVKYAEKMRERLQAMADESFEKAIVFYTVAYTTLSEDLPADASFEMYCEDERAGILGTVAIADSGFAAEQIHAFGKAVQMAGIHGLFRMAVLEEQLLAQLDLEAVDNALGGKEYLHFYVLDVNNERVEVEDQTNA